MAYEQKNNTFSLFKNDYKTEEKHPDLKGTMTVDGKPYQISAWRQEGKNGAFYSGQVSEPYKGKGKRKTEATKSFNPDDEIPF